MGTNQGTGDQTRRMSTDQGSLKDLQDTVDQMRHMSIDQASTPSPLPWRMNAGRNRNANSSTGSLPGINNPRWYDNSVPLATGSPRRMNNPRSYDPSYPPAGPPPPSPGFQRRDSLPPGPPLPSPGFQRHDPLPPNQYVPSPRYGSGRGSFSSNLRGPPIHEEPGQSSMVGIPEVHAVQEMAFRQGQRDKAVPKDRVPPSPFSPRYDRVWQEHWNLGQILGGEPVQAPTTPLSSQPNFQWPVLVNPYTQDLQHPTGSVDAEYSRKICNMSLDSMEALIKLVCRRQPEWEKIVCDIPMPMKQALDAFPDLRQRYEMLMHQAQEALAGGRPYGY